jgi:hypothetical protein
LVIGGLQKKNHGDDDGELKKRKSNYAPYRSREQLDHAHGLLRGLPVWMAIRLSVMAQRRSS